MPAKRKAAFPLIGWQAGKTAPKEHANSITFRLIRQRITDIFIRLLWFAPITSILWEVAR